jgi:NAD(P)H-dependent FMN reductase
MQNIQIILGSTRPQRHGEKVAHWINALAAQQREMKTELIDLRNWPLPFFQESSPQPEIYAHELVRDWVQTVQAADAYIFVTPEYNRSFPAVLKNALDYGFDAWSNKPAAFVAYSGDITGGARAVEHLRQVAIALQMAPIREAIHIPVVWRQFDEQGWLVDPVITRKVQPFFSQLLWWSLALQQARHSQPLALS